MATISQQSDQRARTPRRSRRRRTTDATQRRITWALVGAAALAAGATAPDATGTAVLDALVCATAAAAITLATAHARRWTWVWLAAVALAGAIGSVPWVVIAAIALGAATIGTTERQTHPALGALVGATAGVSLFHLDTGLPDRLPTLLALVAVAPVFVSAYLMSKRRERKLVRRTLLALGVFVVVAGLGFAAGALQAKAELDEAVATSRDALEALRSGDQERAGALFAEAEQQFDDAAGALTAPWALPARAVPVAGQQAAAATTVAEEGRALAGSASRTATTAPYAELRARDGSLDLTVVRSFQTPVAEAASQLEASSKALDEVRSTWLLPQISEPLDDFVAEIDETLPDAQLASATLDAVPPLLGGEGPRRYFVAFANPAEARFQGGFVASYAELLASNGKVTLERSGPIRELTDPDGSEGRTISNVRVFEERYGRWNPERFFQNTTASPDWKVNAEVIRQLYPQAGGSQVDGAIYIDPVGLAALLEITGPVEVPELGRTLDAAGAVEFLTKGQYQDPAVLDDPERQTALVGAADAMFDRLLSEELPTPREIGRILGPAVESGHIAFTAFDADDEEYLDLLGVTHPFVEREGSDWLSVRSSNAGGNKIDAYLERDLAYDVSIDPETSTLEATLTVTLRNTAPAGLPPYVVGNGLGKPEGTNVQHLAVFTPLTVTDASRDGVPLPLEAQTEYGGNVYSATIDIPAGTETTLTYRLTGPARDTDTYRLAFDAQALVNPDEVRFAVRTTDGTVLTAREGTEVQVTSSGNDLVVTTDATRDRALDLLLGPS